MGGGGKINGKQESSQRVCAWMKRIVLRQRSPKFQLAHWSEKKKSFQNLDHQVYGSKMQIGKANVISTLI